jgi:hypothetical protein
LNAINTKFLLLLLCAFCGSIRAEDAVRVPKSASVCSRILGVPVNLFIQLGDPFIAIHTGTIVLRDFLSAKKFDPASCVRGNCSYLTKPEFDKQVEVEESNLRAQFEKFEINWTKGNIILGTFGSVLSSNVMAGNRGSLNAHFRTRLPIKYQDIAIATLEKFYDAKRVVEWVISIRRETLNLMWEAGFRSREHLQEPVLTELYLDRVLARRAAIAGFHIRRNGQPHRLLSFGHYTFVTHLALGHFFVDWTGTGLLAAGSSSAHYARGHSLAMAYAGEVVPNFVELIKYIGRTQDWQGTWGYLFDNGSSTETPLWTGFWVQSLKDILNIRN